MNYHRHIVMGTLCVALLAGCASHTSHSSLDAATLKGRGEAMESVVDAEWKRMGEALNNGQKIEATRVYQLADIRMALRGAQTLAIIGEVNSESRRESRRLMDWVEKAMAAYTAGNPSPIMPRGEP